MTTNPFQEDMPRAAAGRPGAIQDDDRGVSIFAMVGDALAGRWKYAVAIGLLLGLALAWLGHTYTKPEYMSEGIYRVQSTVGSNLGTRGDGDRIVDMRTFVADQAALAKTTPVLSRAVDYLRGDDEDFLDRNGIDPSTLKSLKLDDPDIPIQRLRDGLVVKTMSNSNLFSIEFYSPNPRVAYACSAAIYDSYDFRFGDKWRTDRERELGVLTNLQLDIKSKIADEQVKRGDFAQTYRMTTSGNGNDAIIGREIQAWNVTEADIARVNRELADREEAEEAEAEAGDEKDGPNTEIDIDAVMAPADAREPTDDELDAFDSKLAVLRRQKISAELEFNQVRRDFSVASRQYRTASDNLTAASKDFSEHLRDVRDNWFRAQAEIEGRRDGIDSRVSLGNDLAPYSKESLLKLRGRLEVARAALQERIGDMRAAAVGIDASNKAIQRLEQQLDETDRKITDIEVRLDDKEVARFDKVQPPELPTRPFRDRRKRLAAAGMFMGLAASFGSFFLVGTLDRRTFASRQLRRTGTPYAFLGVVPDMRRRATDPEIDVEMLAAHCIHQVRNRIEAARPAGSFVFAVSSPCQEDGKTSIAIALAWSYARSGHRTLLVDCDLIGEGMTTQFQRTGVPGLREALVEGTPDGYVHAGSEETLHILPAGLNRRFGPEAIRSGALRQLLDQLRDRYDVIIVDTGPMPGSVESIPVAAAVDGLVVSIRRGRSETLLNDCIEAVESVGTPCLGVVLNCAAPADCERFVSTSALSSPIVDEEGEPVPDQAPERGMIARAISRGQADANTPRQTESAVPFDPNEPS